MKKKTLTLGLLALLGIFIFTACEKENDEMKMPADMSIAEFASTSADFSILVQALKKANLYDVLDGTGNFTVFAPTNAAFTALFNALGVTGVSDLSADALAPILLYHVLGEEKRSSMLQSGYLRTLSSANNNFLSLGINTSAGVKLNKETSVVSADVVVKNGVIHVIDKVLLPPTVVDHALANSSFSILVQAVVKAGLVETLNGAGPFTIFAPTNTAFEMLFAQLGISGINDLTAQDLTPILLYHVVSGNVKSTDLSAGSVPTLNGNIQIALIPSATINGNSNIVATDVQGINGIIHVIDKVLIP